MQNKYQRITKETMATINKRKEKQLYKSKYRDDKSFSNRKPTKLKRRISNIENKNIDNF